MVDKNKEEIIGDEQAQPPKPDSLQGLQYFYLHGVKNAFVNALRAAFTDEHIPAEYRYDTISGQSQISIFKNFPQRVQKLPCIVVTTEGGDGSFSYISDEILFESNEPDEDGFTYGGYMTLGVTIDIMAGNIKDMEKLTDLVLMLLRFVFRDKFQDNNIAYSKLTITGETTEDEAVGRIYKNSIGTTVTCDFNNMIPRSIVEKIEQININFAAYDGEDNG